MKKYQSFLSKIFQFLEVKFSIYLNRHVFVMRGFGMQEGKQKSRILCPLKKNGVKSVSCIKPHKHFRRRSGCAAGRAIPKTFKMVIANLSLGAQHHSGLFGMF